MGRGLTLALLLCAVPTRADTTVNFLAASEFAGVGAGLEVGGERTLVMGAGTGFAIGETHQGGFWSLRPGAGLGFRQYIRNWYLGPTVGTGYLVNSDDGFIVHPAQGWQAWALVDLGYRWRWDNAPNWNTKLGIAPGVNWRQPEDTVGFALAFTLSMGFNL
jgi:hypothetical protein